MPLKFHSIDIGPEGDPVIRGFNEESSGAKHAVPEGMRRVIVEEREDLRNGLSTEELLRVYNYLTPKSPIKHFATDDRGVKVVWNQLQGLPEDQDLPAPAGRTTAIASATSAANLGEDEMSASVQTSNSKSRSKKTPAAVVARGKGPVKTKAAKKTAKTGGEAPRKVGVIDEIKRMTQRANGATVSEIVESLVKKFPDRDADGMTTTVRIQVQRLPTKLGLVMAKEKDEKRGLVYMLAADKK